MQHSNSSCSGWVNSGACWIILSWLDLHSSIKRRGSPVVSCREHTVYICHLWFELYNFYFFNFFLFISVFSVISLGIFLTYVIISKTVQNWPNEWLFCSIPLKFLLFCSFSCSTSAFLLHCDWHFILSWCILCWYILIWLILCALLHLQSFKMCICIEQ